MIILVDGHNLIPKLRGFSLKAIDDEMKLVDLLQFFSRVRRTKVEVFFDGAPPGQSGTRSFGTIQTHFVPIGQTADEAIRLKLDQLGPQARETLVITSDHRVQGEARAHKAKFLDSELFAKELVELQASPGEPPAPVKKPARPAAAPPKPPAAGPARSGIQPKLSPSEVDEWLKLFQNNKKNDK